MSSPNEELVNALPLGFEEITSQPVYKNGEALK